MLNVLPLIFSFSLLQLPFANVTYVSVLPNTYLGFVEKTCKFYVAVAWEGLLLETSHTDIPRVSPGFLFCQSA